MKNNFHRLTLITNKGELPTQAYLKFVELCVNAGVTCVQLREKLLSRKKLLYFGQSLKNLLDLNNIPLIINDHIDLCVQLNAAGVHLGQSDGDPIKARSILGSSKLIGLSVNTLQQVQSSNFLPLDYIGIGAIFPTKNKFDIETIWGVAGLKKALKIAAHPIIAIGGINENNIFSVINCGVQGVAAIGAFHDAADPYLATKKLITIINEVNNAG
ncbi:MAG: thiamine phosphate synthase [Proteobacteria bacterium]|nr:thiamine phosphate synthase [Pseudomonadota bacterium]